MAEREIHWFETIGSTMQEAARLAAAGCPSGTIVGAEEQTAGQGRYGRPWHSERGAGLYVTIVLRLPLAPDVLPAVTLALGLAAADAIAEVCALAADLRWPNDVIIAGKKCGGILTQFEHGAVIAGIGINVNQSRFPDDIAPLATSLRIAGGREYSRAALLDALAAAVDRHADLLAREGVEPVLRLFSRASSYVSGRRVVVDMDGCSVQGTTAGLDASGFLLLREDSGAVRTILAGGVRPVPCS